MHQIVLDTETTGLDVSDGHRIIEIGCVEIVDRRITGRRFQQFLNPDREIDPGAVEVHGITIADLADKPRFGDIVQDFIDFIRESELIIHNAPFDVAFINAELKRLEGDWADLSRYCDVLDTLPLARQLHPGQKNTLDALCRRYAVDNSQRELHGALLDAEILTDVYLAMTGGQVSLSLDGSAESAGPGLQQDIRRINENRGTLNVIHASDAELELHLRRLEAIDEASDGNCVWRRRLEENYP